MNLIYKKEKRNRTSSREYYTLVKAQYKILEISFVNRFDECLSFIFNYQSNQFELKRLNCEHGRFEKLIGSEGQMEVLNCLKCNAKTKYNLLLSVGLPLWLYK